MILSDTSTMIFDKVSKAKPLKGKPGLGERKKSYGTYRNSVHQRTAVQTLNMQHAE